MDIQFLIAQINGKLPEGFVRPAILETGLATCQHRRCKRKVAIKKDGTPAKACDRCLARRAASCRRRRKILVAQGGCRRCSYRERLKGDFLCQRCREDRDVERAQKRQDATMRPPSTSSRHSRNASTRRAISIAGLVLGTHARDRSPRQDTGVRSPIPTPPNRGGGGRS